jgi:hypothetical protein
MTSKITKTSPMSHRMSASLKSELRRLAEADRRSLTNYIELVLEDHVATKKRGSKHAAT